jgi:hypothetical protein
MSVDETAMQLAKDCLAELVMKATGQSRLVTMIQSQNRTMLIGSTTN